MNVSFEMEEETPVVETAVTLNIEPLPLLSDLKEMTVVDVADIQPLIELCERRAKAIPKPFDQQSLIECACTIESMKLLERNAKQRKLALQEEHKDTLTLIEAWGKIERGCAASGKAWSVGMNEYLYEVRQAEIREQQRKNAEAEQERIRLAKEKDDAERAAQTAAQAGDQETAAAAIAKVEELTVQADMTMPDVVPMQSKTLDLGAGVTLSGKDPGKEWKLAGWDKAKPMRVLANGKVDPRIASLIGDISKLPPGVLFVLQHVDMNPVHLNASYKGGLAFPAPFTEGLKFGGSVLRGGK